MVDPSTIASAVMLVVGTLAAVVSAAPKNVYSSVTRSGRVAAWEYARLATALTVLSTNASDLKDPDSDEEIRVVKSVMTHVISDCSRFQPIAGFIANIRFTKDYPHLNLSNIVDYGKSFCLLPDCSGAQANAVVKLLLYSQCVFWHERPACKALSIFDYEDDVRPSFIESAELFKVYEVAHARVSSDGLPTLNIPWESMHAVNVARTPQLVTWLGFIREMHRGSGRQDDPALKAFLHNYMHTHILPDI